MRWAAFLLATAGLTSVSAAPREFVVSANDGKPVRPGDTAASRVPDTLTVLEVTSTGARKVGEVAVPASLVGAPESVKMTPDGRYAIVSVVQQVTAGTPPLQPADIVSVVDLAKPQQPRVIQTAHAGAGAAGVAVDPSGRAVLVANGAADTVSLFSLNAGRLTLTGTATLPAKSKPASVRFIRGGRAAIVAATNSGRVYLLTIDGKTMRVEGEGLSIGRAPYGMSLSPSGRMAYVATLYGSAEEAPGPETVGTLTAIDLDRFQVRTTTPLGIVPEGIAVSPSGRYLEATVVNGSQLEPGAPGYRSTGLLHVLDLQGPEPRLVAETVTPGLCQGSVWTRDERHIVLQCAGSRTIELYRFDPRASQLARVSSVPVIARPGAMAGRTTR